MTDLMSIIKGRRSIRRYQEKQIPESDIQQLLDSIRWSPSWANTQCWEVVLVKDGTTKGRLKECLHPTNPAQKAVVEAPVVFALCGRLKISGFYKGEATTKFGDWFMFDLGIAVQSLCLAAHALGLGTVIVGFLDHEKTRQVLELPEGYEVVALVPAGYPAKDSPAPKRREVSEFTHQNRF
ncbi:MAG: nitroreductase family protein [Thermodesulfobacteriota bacterium]